MTPSLARPPNLSSPVMFVMHFYVCARVTKRFCDTLHYVRVSDGVATRGPRESRCDQHSRGRYGRERRRVRHVPHYSLKNADQEDADEMAKQLLSVTVNFLAQKSFRV